MKLKILIVACVFLACGLPAFAQITTVGSTSVDSLKSCIQAMSTNTLSFLPCVYKVDQSADVDRKIVTSVKALSDQIDIKLATSSQQVNDSLNKGLTDAEARLKSTLTDAVNQMPQRLLSDAAKQEIADSLRAEIKAQIDQLRKDLQQQIDSLKEKSSSTQQVKSNTSKK